MEAKKHLRTGQVEEISMDHDLGLDHIEIPPAEELSLADYRSYLSLRGEGVHTGLELARWMVANKLVPSKVTIHSWRPRGAEAMRVVFENAGFACNVTPFVLPEETMAGETNIYTTKTGKVLTDADIEKLSEEAERGYNVEKLLAKRRNAPDSVRGSVIITPLQVVVATLQDALVAIEGDDKGEAINNVRKAILMIVKSDGNEGK